MFVLEKIERKYKKCVKNNKKKLSKKSKNTINHWIKVLLEKEEDKWLLMADKFKIYEKLMKKTLKRIKQSLKLLLFSLKL